jgi:hypothetical protein
MCAQPCVELGQPDRLRQVIVRTGLQADHDVHLVRAGGQHDDHGGGLGSAQPATDLHTVQVG